MGKIIVSENATLDGVIQDPAGDEGFRAGGWVGLIKDSPPLNKLALDEALGAEALLLGRRSYEWFAARWPSRSGELADRLNSMPKYVVSSVLGHPAWNNSTVLQGGVLNEVAKLKQMLDGDIVVPASFQLVRTLLEHGLVDELRLKIFPVVLGAGERLVGETSDSTPVRLVDIQTIEGGIAFLTYRKQTLSTGSRPCLPEIPAASRSYRPESAAWAMWDNSAGRSGSDRSQAAAGIMSRCRTSLTAPKPCRASRAAIASGANSESQGSPRSADAWPIRSA